MALVRVSGGYLEVEIAGQPPGIWGGGNVPMPTPPIYIPIPGPPSEGGEPSHPIYIPVYPAHPIAPGGGYPSHPIAPGGEHPDHGLPGGGGGGGHPSHPIHIPGVPDQGLPEPEPIPPEGVTPPTIPPGHEDDLVVAVRQPHSTDWTYNAYDVAPDQGQPIPQPTSKRRKS